MSAFKGLTIEIDGDVSGLSKAINHAQKEFKNLSKDLKAVEDALKLDPGNADLMARKLELLAQAGEAAGKQASASKKYFSELDQALKDGKITSEQYQIAVNKLNTQILKNDTAIKKFSRSAEDGSKNLNSINKTIEQLKSSFTELNQALELVQKGFSALSGAGGAVVNTFKGLTDFYFEANKQLLDLAKNTASYADDILTLSRNYDVSTDFIQGLKHSAGLLDVELDTVLKAIGRMQKGFADSGEASLKFQKAFKGLSTNGNIVTNVNDAVRAIEAIKNPSEQSAKAVEVFGKSFDDLRKKLLDLKKEKIELPDVSAQLDELKTRLKIAQEEFQKTGKISFKIDIEEAKKLDELKQKLTAAYSDIQKTGKVSFEINIDDTKKQIAELETISAAASKADIETAKKKITELEKIESNSYEKRIELLRKEQDTRKKMVEEAQKQVVTISEYEKRLNDLGVKTRENSLKKYNAEGELLEEIQGKALSAEKVFRNMVKTIAEIKNPMEQNALSLELFGKSAIQMQGAFRDGGAALFKEMERAKEVGAVLSKQQLEFAGEYQDALDKLTLAFEALKLQLGAFVVKNLKDDLDSLAESVLKLLTEVNKFGLTSEEGKKAVAEFVKGAIKSFEGLSKGVLAVWQEVAKIFEDKELMTSVNKLISDIINELIKNFEQFYEILTPVIEKGIQALLLIVEKVYPQIESTIFKLYDILSPVINSLLKQIAVKVIEGLGEAIKYGLGQTWEAIVKFFTEENFISKASNLINPVEIGYNLAQDLTNSLADFLIKHDFKSFVEFGKNIVNGLKSGIESAWASFASWFSDRINALAEAAKSILKIQSPSKVFQDIGKQVTAGLEKGIGTPDLSFILPKVSDLSSKSAQNQNSTVLNISVNAGSINSDLDLHSLSQKLGNLTVQNLRLQGVV